MDPQATKCQLGLYERLHHPLQTWSRTSDVAPGRGTGTSVPTSTINGARLVDAVLMPGRGTARVAINANFTGPELDEQKGLANLVKGLFSMYRNPAAHEPRLHRTVTDEELLELLTTLSMVHRRLDGSHITS